ncbi:MAG: rhomboid family intramembrane serine protease [Planctomycetota bacterium]
MNATFATVYESSTRRSCMEMHLVLEAMGLSAHMSRVADRWRLMVAENQVGVAIAEISAYLQDERDFADVDVDTSSGFQTGLVESFLSFAFVIIACSMVGWSATAGEAVTELGHVDSGLVQQGQIWRSVTALTLHADLAHLMSNLVFGALFIVLAGTSLGGGLAFLTTIVAGASGNLVNAFVHDASHASLGASTAVFAALGIGVANALRPVRKTPLKAFHRWRPLVAGGLLLAMVGTGGERTDVGAHIAGFASGLAVGWFVSPIPQRWIHHSSVQMISGAAAAILVMVAWVIALTSS